jgi:Acetyltransferase (GNAT) domain
MKYFVQFRETEIGWLPRPDTWGHGFAIEAARACADGGFRNLDVPYVTAMIGPDNLRSVRVAERLGMTASALTSSWMSRSTSIRSPVRSERRSRANDRRRTRVPSSHPAEAHHD